MNEWINEWMNEWMNEWVNEWTNEWTNKQMNESVNDLKDRWMNERFDYCYPFDERPPDFLLNISVTNGLGYWPNYKLANIECLLKRREGTSEIRACTRWYTTIQNQPSTKLASGSYRKTSILIKTKKKRGKWNLGFP